MKTVQEAYEKYKIMPTLQLHQLRVASVAKIICDNLTEKMDANSVVLACLFHDMGNIIKSDLTRFPEFLEPEGLDYWQGVKDGFIQKYGTSEHVAVEIIVKEIGVSEKVQKLINEMGFRNAEVVNIQGSLENKISCYSDMRVDPHAVVSMESRLAEGRKRYSGRATSMASDAFELLANALRKVEIDIFASTNIKPEDVTDDKVKEIMGSLRNFPIN